MPVCTPPSPPHSQRKQEAPFLQLWEGSPPTRQCYEGQKLLPEPAVSQIPSFKIFSAKALNSGAACPESC